MPSFRSKQPKVKVHKSIQQHDGTSHVETTEFTTRQAAQHEREVQQRRQEHAAELARARASLLASFESAPRSQSPDEMNIDGDIELIEPEDALNGWEDVQDSALPLLEAYRAFRLSARPHRVRNWSSDRARAQENWTAQLQSLVDAYLELQHTSPSSIVPPLFPVPDSTSSHGPNLSTAPAGSPTIQLVDLYGASTIERSALHGEWVNVSLVCLGFLGSTPISPNVAFSLRTLLAYHRLKLRARTSKQGFIQALCDLSNIPYSRWLKSRFSDAVDVYSSILRSVEERINQALSRDNEWRMKNSCPACAYECVDEEPLVYQRQFTMDGNDSLKRFETPGISYDRAFPSRYVLSRTEVDLCANEVPRRRQADDVDAAGPEEGHECGTRWRAARPDSEKTKSWEVLDETGIFVCMCRHGFILTAADMWKSGELAKYPLSIVKKIVQLFGTDNLLMVGYDIGCAHSGTAARSSFGELVKQCIRFVVGSFHGHAHNRTCQLGFHPRNVFGAGREPFEGCEQLFAHSNLFAFLMRHASKYHRLEDIDNIFAAWDADKYAHLGELLLAKFKDAKEKIEEHEAACTIASTRGLGRAEFEQFLADELEYLRGREPVQDDDDVPSMYVKTLQKWWAARDDVQRLASHGVATSSNRQWTAAMRKSQRLDEELIAFELRFNYLPRWTEESPEYVQEVNRGVLRKYERAVDNLERAVVSRLFELEKAFLRGTGYKLRKQIGKALSKRATALRNVLQKYNAAAAALPSARPPLAFQDILDANFLDEIPLLREARSDILNKPWARPETRRLTTAWLETQRAHEELKRVRVESVRVRTWIRDEEARLDNAIRELSNSSQPRERWLASALDARADLLFKTHTKILTDLDVLDMLDGQQPRQAGSREGETPPTTHPLRPLERSSAQRSVEVLDGQDDGDAEDDEEQQELDMLVDTVAHMALAQSSAVE